MSSLDKHLLATVTSTISTAATPLRLNKLEMDLFMMNELMPRTGDKNHDPSSRVLWEEKFKAKRTTQTSKSILDDLISKSLYTIQDISDIKYVKKQANGDIMQGVAVLQLPQTGSPLWQNASASAFSKKKKRKIERNKSQTGNCHSDKEIDQNNDVNEDRGEYGDGDGEDIIEMDASWSDQSFHMEKKRRKSHQRRSSEEKQWEHLLRSIQYSTGPWITEANKFTELCSPLPIHVLPKPSRVWTSALSATPFSNPANTREPDLILMGQRGKLQTRQKDWSDVLTGIEITKSKLTPQRLDAPVFLGVVTKCYLVMRAQPWRRFVLFFSISSSMLHAHYLDRSGLIISSPISINSNAGAVRFVEVLNTMTLLNHSYLGFDPTIHVCNDACFASPHEGLPEGIDEMLPHARGWVIGNSEDELYWIMAILWKSQGLFSRGTVCYRVRDKEGREYALKDCWVDVDNLHHEVDILRKLEGLPNVVSLVKHWDVQYGGSRDTTSNIRQHLRPYLPTKKAMYCERVHRRMLLTPCGLPLTSFKDVHEFISVFRDLVVAHEAMVQRRVLHSDLSPNNLIVHEGKGYFIDFDHAKLLENDRASSSHGTGTIPYMSSRILMVIGEPKAPTDGPPTVIYKPEDDLESLFYIFLDFTTIYGGPDGQMTGPEGLSLRLPILNCRHLNYESGTLHSALWGNGVMKEKFMTVHQPAYKVTDYFKDCCPIVEDWHKSIGKVVQSDIDRQRMGSTDTPSEISFNDLYKEIRSILEEGLKDIEKSPHTPSPLPPSAPPSSGPAWNLRPRRKK